MNGDRPLVMETDSDEVRALLRSAELDGPPSGAMRRVLTRAGVGVGIVAIATSTTVSSAAKVGPLVVGKWLALATFVGAGAVAVVHVARPSTSMKVESHPAVMKTASEPATLERPAAPATEANDPAANEPSNAAAPIVQSPRALKASPSGNADINGEIAAITLARGALDKGNARAGLAALDRYQQDYAHGALAPEATVLRIEALLMAGERARAKSLGEAFLKAHPKSPHAQRVRSLIAPL
jgi:hypothetical protein